METEVRKILACTQTERNLMAEDKRGTTQGAVLLLLFSSYCCMVGILVSLEKSHWNSIFDNMIETC